MKISIKTSASDILKLFNFGTLYSRFFACFLAPLRVSVAASTDAGVTTPHPHSNQNKSHQYQLTSLYFLPDVLANLLLNHNRMQLRDVGLANMRWI